jgi:fused signal recognition particle receptor
LYFWFGCLWFFAYRDKKVVPVSLWVFKSKACDAKVVIEAPHEVLLVLDGSTGQNAFEQARQFTAATEVTSLAVTKLDGTAKGGVVIGISDQFKIPVKYIGVGEGMEDLQVFNKHEFVDSFFK